MQEWWLSLEAGQQIVFTIIGLLFLGAVGNWILELVKILKDKKS